MMFFYLNFIFHINVWSEKKSDSERHFFRQLSALIEKKNALNITGDLARAIIKSEDKKPYNLQTYLILFRYH